MTDEPQAEASLSLDTNDFTLFSAGSSYTLKATVQPLRSEGHLYLRQ